MGVGVGGAVAVAAGLDACAWIAVAVGGKVDVSVVGAVVAILSGGDGLPGLRLVRFL